MKPICVDLFCGLGGWSAGFLANGYQCWGFDIERHDYGPGGYPGDLALQDILTLHGSQFRDAAVIVASPPCQNYSYLAMPWSRSKDPDNSKSAKALRLKWETEGPDNRLFDACFRIQREVIEAAGCHIPMIVENVQGAIPWVGRSRWHYGSFHLWGDVPALMPITFQPVMKRGVTHRANGETNFHGVKVGGPVGNDWFAKHNRPEFFEGIKLPSNNTPRRKAASAQIAMIPFPLSNHLAKVFKPEGL